MNEEPSDNAAELAIDIWNDMIENKQIPENIYDQAMSEFSGEDATTVDAEERYDRGW